MAWRGRSASLSYSGDIDYFSFAATTGQTYDILVEPAEPGLDDSTLWLYDTDGETVWVETGWQLRAIDVSDPTDPWELAVLDMDGQVGQILPRGERAYVGLAAVGVIVLDISDASAPQVLDQYVVGCTSGVAAASGKYLLIPTGTKISVFDADIAPHITHYDPSGTIGPTVTSVTFTFDRPMLGTSFSLAADISSFTGPAGPLTATGYNWIDNYTLHLQVSFDPQTATGAYEMVINPDILDLDGIALDQDGDGIPGELLDDRVAAQFTIEQVCQVYVVRGIDYEAPGSALDDEFEYHVGVLGATIVNIEYSTPWGETLSSADHLPPAWSGEYVFKVVGNLELEAGTEDGNRWMDASWDLESEQWEALDTADTQIQVFYPGGIWTGSVNFSHVAQPVQEPTLTNPVHDQTDVSWRPAIAWEGWISAPARVPNVGRVCGRDCVCTCSIIGVFPSLGFSPDDCRDPMRRTIWAINGDRASARYGCG